MLDGRRRSIGFALTLVCLIPLTGCGEDPVDGGEKGLDFLTTLTITPNPVGYAPLTAEVRLTTSRPVQVEVLVAGRDGPAGDVRHRFDDVSQQATLPVLGLYPNWVNTITLRFFDAAGALLGDTSRSTRPRPVR
jgi:hypothetical protein